MLHRLKQLLDTSLPERVGWPHVFGSMLLALFAMQFLTGILLSFVYSPSSLTAYQSVSYLEYQTDFGSWLRAIHYWGSSLIIIVVALHLIRTFLYAAYRSPRKITWMIGVLLLLSTLAFAQTGFLLTWDQKAYWGTSVTLEILQTIPWIGPYLKALLQGGSIIGTLTLSRFFTFHAVILPILTILLIAGHLHWIRKHGITPPWSNDENVKRPVPFYPYQAARDATAMFLMLFFLLFIAWFLPAPLEKAADPTDTTFVPRPDWYFLFLFQMLHYFKGKWQIAGTFVIPFLAITVLFFLPYLDRNPTRNLRKRPFALSGLAVTLFAITFLTYAAIKQTPERSESLPPQGIAPPRNERIKRPSEIGGLYVLQNRCFECHSMTVSGSRLSLRVLAARSFPSGQAWLEQHLTQHNRPTQFNSREVEEVLSTLRVLTADDPLKLYTIPRQVRLGAHLFYQASCINCHKIDGQGGNRSEKPGPDLTFRPLKSKQWHMLHIRDSRQLVEKSTMPPFLHYEPYEYAALAEYILYLHRP